MTALPAVVACLGLAATPSVTILPVGSTAESVAVARELGRALTLELLTRADVVSVKDEGPRADEAALALYRRASEAFEALELETAVQRLTEALPQLAKDPLTADYRLLREGYMRLAIAAFRVGEEGVAKNALLELVRIDPEAALPAGYPPVFERELEKARRRLEKQPTARLQVEGPPGATVLIDGRDVGAVPVVEHLPVGRHGVKIIRGPGEQHAQLVELTEEGARVEAVFAEGPEGPVGPVIDRQVVQTIVRRARGAELVLVAYVSAGNVRAVLVSTPRGDVVSLPRRAAEPVQAAAVELADALVRRAVNFGVPTTLPVDLRGTEPPPAAPPRVSLEPKAAARPTGEGPLSRYAQEDQGFEPPPEVVKPGVPAWVWIITAGVVAAGAGVGGYFAHAALTRPVTGRVTATW